MRIVIYLQMPTVIGKLANYFCQLLNVHGIDKVKQRETHSAEILVTEHQRIST